MSTEKPHNWPAWNQEALKDLRRLASGPPHAAWIQAAYRQALKMEAALELVLLFHTAETWTPESRQKWHNLQIDCGIEKLKDVTTRGLCDAIREVLGKKDPYS